MKGDKWESPVFSLGSAPASSDIPKPGDITRKDHSVTSGGVRGPQNVGNTGSMTNNLKDPAAQAAGTTNGSATNGFSNQVDQAFSKDGTTNGNTTLGSNNPVFSGRA